MNYLFVHQNFPGQFRHIAAALANDPDNRVVGFAMNGHPGTDALKVINYRPARANSRDTHPLLQELETKVIRGEAAYRAALALKQSGFYPDAIIVHPGWGEGLFLKDVWPDARIGLYCEFFYQSSGADVNFDPEFPDASSDLACRVRFKNANNLMHLAVANAGIAPTRWQAETFPSGFREQISVIHDGIVTEAVVPNPQARITLNGRLTLSKSDEIVTFISRNLEPYRGYHRFMRALPALLRSRPQARVIIVGGDGASYGKPAPAGSTWKHHFLREVIGELDMSRVHFVGKLSYANFLSLLQVSSVHVYLTYPFVLSWSLLEAMSAACAIVASNTPPVAEVISHDRHGLLVDFFDSGELSETVAHLLADPVRRVRLGAEAREHIVSRYDLRTNCLPRQMAWARRLAAG